MKVTFDNELNELEKNESLEEAVAPSSDLKELIVNYVGTKKNPENDEVTLEMVLDTFTQEFPEFVLPLAEENFIRGYNQALYDVEEGQKAMKELQENE
jgi:hypothetical protein